MTQLLISRRPTGTDQMFIQDLVDDFSAVTGVVNGQLKDDNLAAGAALTDGKLASPNNVAWKTLFEAGGVIINATGSGDRMWGKTGVPATLTGVSVDGIGGVDWFSFVPGDYVLPGKTLKLRTVLYLGTNGTASTRNFLGKLYEISAAGAANSLFVAPVQFGVSTAAINAPGANAMAGPVVSADFDGPSVTKHFILGMNVSGAVAAGSVVCIAQRLEYRYV